MKIVKTILAVLFGLMFINAGLDKFLHYMPVPPMEGEMLKVGTAFGTIVWLMPLVGAIELLGGLLFAIPKTLLFLFNNMILNSSCSSILSLFH